MTNPLQLLRDFRKWRQERYDEAYEEVLDKIGKSKYTPSLNNYIILSNAYREGVRFGIEHRKEILKQVKI